jgi:hypothetical protein
MWKSTRDLFIRDAGTAPWAALALTGARTAVLME